MAGSKAHNRLWVQKVRRRLHKDYKPYTDPLPQVLTTYASGRGTHHRLQTRQGILWITRCRDRRLVTLSALEPLNQALAANGSFQVRMGSKSKTPVVDLAQLLRHQGIKSVSLS